jgi:2'-5' RNA ligase
MSQVRAFVAIHLNDEMRNAVAGAQAELKTCGAAVRWVKPESLHLTLKFLGDIDLESVPQAAAVMADAIEDVEPFPLVFRGLDALPRIAQPRVVYVGVHDERGRPGREA